MKTAGKTKRIVRAALIAGIYVALCLLLAPLSYGPRAGCASAKR